MQIKKRVRFFVAVEGKSEESFMKWVHEHTRSMGLSVHLDIKKLDGGGFKGMLRKAVAYHKQGSSKGKYFHSFLFVDSDRSFQGDWSMNQLRIEAAKHSLEVCAQFPNFEGLLLSILSGENKVYENSDDVLRKLRFLWKDYVKPADTLLLNQKLTLEKLLQVAQMNSDLANMLGKIGLLSNKR